MILFNSFLHRQQLADIIARWMVDRLEPGDVRQLKLLVNLNCYLARHTLDEVAQVLFTGMAGGGVGSFAATTKGVLKDYLIDHPPVTNDRISAMIARYRAFPQDFYRETPFDGRIYYQSRPSGDRYLGTTRRKRFKRVAEKTSRRIIDFVFEQIKGEATTLARERAQHIGVPVNKLITPVEKRDEEFVHAERRIIKRIRLGHFIEGIPLQPINDVLGVKVLCEDDQVQRLTSLMEQHPRMDILECEMHTGNYNAINVALSYRIDRDALLRKPLSAAMVHKLAARGFAPEQSQQLYDEFIRSGEDNLILEVIVANYQEILESEIGRSMHEERTLRQRGQQQYRSSLATNIAALIEFMMTIRRYPTDELEQIPIKLWIKYMPDYFESVMKTAHGISESVYLAP